MSKPVYTPPASVKSASSLRRQVVRVAQLPLAAAVSLGAGVPWAVAQTTNGTVITTLSGSAATQTLVNSPQVGLKTVTTTTLRDGNAFNNFSRFQVGNGDTVQLVVPTGANWLVNVVRDGRVQVDGVLQSRLGSDAGAVGGNLLFIDRHGFGVGPNGRIDTGRLTFAAPSTTFVDAMLASGPGLSANQVTGILSGQFERSSTGSVRIDGEINARDGVQIMAGQGQDAAQAVVVNGRVMVGGRAAGSAVNLGDLRSLNPVVERDGVIDITTPGDVLLNGKLLADASHWNQAGGVRVVAGGNIDLGAQALVSATAALGSGGQGGQVSLFAHGSASNAAGATLAARGDGTGAGGFIELSAAKQIHLNSVTLDAGSDQGPAGLAYIDPEDLVVSGSVYTNGANLSLDATKTLKVNSGVTLNTRKVTAAAGSASGVAAAATAIGNNPSTPSLGHSGNITLDAPSITVQSGATLDASVINQSGTTYTAGDITLTASKASEWVTFISMAEANASIDVAGTLTGRNVTLTASIESAASFGGTSGTIQQELVNLALSEMPFAASLSYVQAKGNATVTLQPTAVLRATENIALTAMADRSVSVETATEGSAKANLSAGFARVLGNTTVDVKGGASLQADGDIALVAASKTTVSMASAAAGVTDPDTGAANVASIVFAGSTSEVNTTVNVAAGATLQSGGDVLLQAFHSGQYDTTAEVTVYGGGTAGVVGALSLQKSTTSVTMDGQITADGHVSIMAMNASAKNAISATSANASEEEEESALAGLPTSLEYSKDDAGAAAEAGLLASFKAMADEVSGGADTESGGAPAESKPPALRLAGALTWSESHHTTRATVGAGAIVTAGGNAVVDAQTLVGQLQSVATAEATSDTKDSQGTKVSLAAAFNYGNHNMTTRALVGSGAQVTGNHVAVHAATDMPEFYTNGLPLDWSSFSSAYANIMGGTDFLLDGFNTRVGATSSATNLAAAGAVNLSFMKNDTRAWVDTGAKLTTHITGGAAWTYDVKEVGFDSDLVEMLIPINTYSLDKDLGVLGDFVSTTRVAPTGPAVDEINFTRSFTGSTVVKAANHVQSLHHAGGPAPAAGASGTSVGGTFSMVSRDNTAIAGIADRAEINTFRLETTAETDDWLVSISPTSGQGAGVAVNGIASYNKLKETTRASISREAFVNATQVVVEANASLGVIAMTGAVSRSENSGVGIGLAINSITGDTRAYVGDNDADSGGADTTEGTVGAIVAGAMRVEARTDGKIVAMGVAGATAGEKPPAAPKSTGENLADKTATDSADTQAQLDGSDASMAPVAEASEPAKGSGSDSAAASEPAASKPPSFAIAGAGAIVTNTTDLDTTALVDRAVIKAEGAGTLGLTVRALSDLTQVSVAGGGALAMSKNASTTFSAAIAGAVALQKSDDDTTARIVDSSVTDLADTATSLNVQAIKSGERTAVATGISANLSKGSKTSVSVVGAASVTTTNDDTLASIENSTVTGNVASPTATGVTVVAYDRSRIGAGGGALSVSTGKGSAGVGAAVSIVNAKGSTQAQVSGGALTQAHDLSVLALSSQKVVGVGAVAGVQTSSDATSAGQLMGSFVTNHVSTTVSAGVKNSAVVNLTGDLIVQGGGTAASATATLDSLIGAVRASEVIDFEMSSASNGYTSEFKDAVGGESVVGVAGTLSVTLGSNASSLGLSYVHNDIQTTYGAQLNGSITTTGGVSVSAISRADIVGVSAGVGATKGKFSGMGSASVNLMGQRTQAQVTGGTVTASQLSVNSETNGNTFGLAGNLSFAVGGGNGKAAGAAVAYTQNGTRTYTSGGSSISTRSAGNAATIDATTVNVGSGTVQVQASNTSDVMSVAASGAASTGNVGFAGTVTVNETADVTEARIGTSTVTGGTVRVQAGEGSGASSARIRSLAGGVSASKGYSGALALGYNTIESTRSAQILSSTINAGTAVSVLADSDASIQTLSVTLAGGKDYAAAGSSSTNVLNGTTLSNVDNSTLNGAATTLTVHASQAGSIESLAGAVTGGGTGAIGGSVAVNHMGKGPEDFKVTARLKDSVLVAPVAVTVDAKLDGSIRSVAASGSGAGTTAINGSVTSNVIESDVQALVVGGSQNSNGGAFKVLADNDADIASLAGTISGAGTAGAGVAVSTNEIGGNVTASLQSYTLRATGAVQVDATSSGNIGSIAAGLAGGGTNALAGSNTTNAITSQVLAQMSSVTQSAASSSLRVKALDSSIIKSFAGTVSGGGTAGGGAAFALNFLGRTATNADSSKGVKAQVLNSSLNSGGAVQVQALSSGLIESMGMAVAGGGSGAVSGSNTTNLLEDDIVATWSGGSLNGTATSLTVQADDSATVRTLAGNVAGSGGGAFGAAIAVNQVGSAVQATLTGMTLNAAPAVVVDADMRGEIKSVAASGAASSGASVNGSFTTNQLTASVKAQATSVTQATNGGAFTVSADNDSDIFSLAGTISGSGAAAIGAAVAVNEMGGDVTARVADSTLRATGALGVTATSSGTIKSVAAGMSGGGTVALAGSNTTNAITSQVLAQVSGVTQSASSSSVRVKALDSSVIQSFAGTVSGGGTAAGGAAFALNFLGRTATNADSSKGVKAEVVNSSMSSGGAVQVQALSTATIQSMGMAVGGSGSGAVTGSNTTNLLEDEITATWSGGSLYGTATSLTVQADDAATVRTFAGNVSGSAAGAFGAAIAVNQVGSAVQAHLSGMTLHAAAAVAVDADLRGEIKSVAASGAADGVASVNGSFTTNQLTASVKAQAVSVLQVTNGGAFSVTADNDSDIFSLAGTISGSGGAAVGAAVAVNEIGGDVTARVASSTVRAPGQVDVQATSSGAIKSVAAGMSGGGSVALAGSNTTNAITSTVLAQLDSTNLVVNASAVNVLARDTSSIQSFAGTVAGGGAAGGGAALALNYLGRTAGNADSSKVVKAEVLASNVRVAGPAVVSAYSTSSIESIGVAAGASGTAAISGSNATNLLEDEITANWTGTNLSSTSSLTVSARQASNIDSLAGNVSGSLGAAVGAAVAVNRIGTVTRANLLGEPIARFYAGQGNWTLSGDDLVVSTESDNEIDTIAVGMSAGAAGVQGSVAVSVINAQTHTTVGADATVSDLYFTDSVAITANSRDRIRALAGAVGFGAAGVGAAGGVLTNIITSSTTAGVVGLDTHINAMAQGSGLTVRQSSLASAPNLMNINQVSDSVMNGASFGTRTVKGLAVQATAIQQIGAVTAVAGGGFTGAAGAAINVDQIGGTTRAYIDKARFIQDTAGANAAQSLDVMAANHAMVASSASALAIGGVGVSGSLGTEIVERATRAEIIGGARVFAKGAADVKAVSTNSVAQISVGAAGGASAGLAGSGDVVLLKGTTEALIDNSTLSADTVSVVADGTNSANLVAGSIAGGGALGAGLSFTVNVSGSTVRAKVNNTTLKADGAVVIDADNRTESFAVSAAAAVGGLAGVAVGAAVTVMEGATEAGLTGTSTLGRRTLATGLVASSNNAPVAITLASDYDQVGTGNQTQLRFSLNDLNGRVNPASAVVTVSDGELTVTAVRQSDGTYTANVASLADGPLMAKVVLTESGTSKASSTTLFKSTGINSSETAPVLGALPVAATRIATLSSFDQVDARNDSAVRFVLKGDSGIQPTGTAVVTVGDGTRSVTATRNADGSYTADVRTLGDGVLTAVVTTGVGETSRVTLNKASGAGSLSVTANETVTLNHNAGQIGVGGVAGIGSSANVVVGKSTVVAKVDASSVRVSGALNVKAEREANIDMITATAGGGGFVGVSGAVGVLVFGSAPDSNANSELTGSSSTLGQIGSVTQANRSQGSGSALTTAESDSANNSGRYDTQGAYAGASGSHRTSATVAATTVTAGSLTVASLDRTSVDNNAGAVALGGAAGISAGVAITLLGGANHAGVSVGNMAVAGNIDIQSGNRTPSEGVPAVESRAISGAGGFVGVGAAVSVASNTTASTASLAGTSSAGGSVNVQALDQASMRSEAVGATAGVVSVGVVTATATQSGSVATTVSGQHSGTGWTAQAERSATAAAQATGGSAGVYAGSGAGATASDSGSVTLTLASNTVLDAGTGDLSLLALSTPSADAYALGVSVGRGVGMGVSVALSEVDTNVQVLANGPLSLSGKNMLVNAVLGHGDSSVTAKAVAGGGGLLLGAQGAGATASNQGTAAVTFSNGATLAATGDVAIMANDAMRMNSESTGVGVGFVGAGVAVAMTESNSTVSSNASGLAGRVQGTLTVSARGDELIDADAVAGSGGVVAGAGADARINHVQNVSATLSSSGSGLLVDGLTAVTAERKVRFDTQASTINASAFGGSGAVTVASLTGSATAKLGNNAKLTGAQLQILATNDVERTDLTAINVQGGGGGVIAGAGADAKTILNGNAVAEIGDDVVLNLGDSGNGLLEVRAYNQFRGSSLGRLDIGGALPIALVDTEINSIANATAKLGARDNIQVAGDVHVNALSYVDIEANTITKTYGAAAAAQGDALALANVTNLVSVGTGTQIVGENSVSLLAGQDKDFWRNKNFVTARADLFNHSAIPVSVNPDVQATLNLTNNLTLDSQSVRSGGLIQLGGISGTYIVEGKGKVSDWTREVGELMGLSSEYGSSNKTLTANVALKGLIEAGYGNKQKLVINANGSVASSEGNIRYSIGTEDLAATGAAYLETLYNQLKNYGDIPEVRAFVEAEMAFYLQTLLREGFATIETDPDTGATQIVPQENVPGTFLTLKNIRAGSGNVELFGNNVTGTATVVARADSEILIDNKSPMNIRAKDLIIDSSGGFAKYNGTYLKSNADIASFNRDVKTGINITVDSIDTRGGGPAEALPTIKILNSYVSTGVVSANPVIATAPDGSSADLRQDQMRSPEIRVNGLAYNKLGSILLDNTSGSISVIAEDALYTPRLDGLEITVNSGKNFVLSSPTVSQSIGGSPENLYAVAYNDDQQNKLNNMGVVRCGTARAGSPASTSFSSNCLRNGTGGIYASGGIFLGARYLNINGTIQSGQSDYAVTLTDASVGSRINSWKTEWPRNRSRSPLLQISGRLSTDSELDVTKRFENGTITQTQRDNELAAIAARRKEPIIHYNASTDRLQVAETNITGGLVEMVGSIINTGGGVVRALDGFARFNIDNQTSYGLDLLGLDTGGDAGVVRITDLNRPVYTGSTLTGYEVTTYERNVAGVFKSTTTAGRGATAAVLRSSNSTLASPNPARPELLATFNYNPVTNSTYVWSAGYEYNQEKRYWYQKSSMLWGAINLKAINWNSVETIVKTASAMAEGIYVTTASPPSGNFWMGTQTITTDAEKEIYKRQWKKCGFMCFKKTFYVDYRTEVGSKDVFTQRVRADHPIAIEMVGYTSGLIQVASKKDIRFSGDLVNDVGLVSLTSSLGSIVQQSGGTSVTGDDLRFYAATGIGSQGSPINVITGTGSFTATSTKGNIAFQSLGGALRINQVSTTGKIWLFGDEDIVGVDPSKVHVSGSSIEISAPRGGIGSFNADGSVKSTLNIQTENSAGGGITATAARGIALKQATGNLWVNQVASSGGDVYIEAGGDLIDNNRNETRDVRTEEELLALWKSASLQGADAEVSRQQTLRSARNSFRRYWGLRNAVVTSVNPSTGAVVSYTADSYNPATYAFTYTTAEKQQLSQNGLSAAQITALESARTQELKDLHALYGTTAYQTSDTLIIDQINAANVAAGRPAVDAMSTWSTAELSSPLPKAIFSKSSTDTQTRIEAPNVIGNRVVLRPGGKIGRDDGAVTINLLKAGGLTTEDQLTIMSAESDDMVLNKSTWMLTVVKKDTFDVLSNKLNLTSNGFVYLGSESTDAYPNGGDANLEKVVGNGEIRIKVSGSVLNASGSTDSVIQGHKAILEAATGSIGTSLKPVTMTLTGGGTPSNATLVARAQDGIWITQTGDMRIADVYSPGFVGLTAQNAIIDARGTERTRSLEAGEASLTALNGSVGTLANPLVVKASASGGVNASTPTGFSVYLQGAETGLSVKNINSGLDIDLYSPTGNLQARGNIKAIGRLSVETEGTGDIVMESGSMFQAVSGDIFVGADDVGLGRLDAARAVVVNARGAMTNNNTDTSLINATGRSVTLQAVGSIGTSTKAVDVLPKEVTRLIATSSTGDAYLSANSGILRVSQVVASGMASLSSAYSIFDERGTNAQSVQGTNIALSAGGDLGQSNLPMTLKTAANGVVTQASAYGSVYVTSPWGVLTVQNGQATTGQISLNGSAYGLNLTGTLSAAQGLTLNAGAYGLNLASTADLSNQAGSVVMKGSTIAMADGAKVHGGLGTLVLTATGDISLTGLSSDNATRSAILVSTTAGAVRDAGDANAYDLKVTAAGGGVSVSALGDVGNAALASSAAGRLLDTDASVLQITSKTGAVTLAQNKATTDVAITSAKNIELLSQGSVVGSKLSALGGGLLVRSAAGGVQLSSGTSTQNLEVTAAGLISLGAITVPGDILITSTTSGGVTAQALTAGLGIIVSAGTAGNLSLGALKAQSGTVVLAAAGGTLSATSASATGNITLDATGNTSVGTLSSSTGAVDVEVTAGTLTTGAVSGSSAVAVKSSGNLSTGALTSTNAAINAQSTAGSVALASARANTGLVVNAKNDLTITTYSVSAGTAALTAGTTFTGTSGTATGHITLDAVGNTSVGAVSSSAGTVDLEVTSGTLTTGAVSGLTGLVLKSSGNLATGALTSANAGINAQSTAGSVALASAKAASSLVAKAASTLAVTTYAVSGGTAALTAGTTFTGTSGTATGNITLDAVGNTSVGAVTSSAGTVDLEVTAGTLTTGAVSGLTGLVLKSSGNLATGALTSANAGINAQSTAGSVALASAKAASGLVANAKTTLAVTTYAVSAGTASLTAGTTYTGTSGTASGNITLDAVGNTSVGAVTSSGGTVDLEVTAGTLTTGAVSGGLGVTLKSSGNLGTGALTSLSGGLNALSSTGSVVITSAKAATSLVANAKNDLNVTTYAVSGGTAVLTAGTTFTGTSGTATGHITLDTVGNASVGAVSSSQGTVDLETTAGTLTTGAVSGVAGVVLKSSGNLSTGALTSTNAGINAQSTAGSVALASAKAGTSLVANANAALNLTTYTVSGGTATLTAGTTFTGTSGTASGNITLDAVGITSVGTVTSSAGSIDLDVTAGTLTTAAVTGLTGVVLKSSGNLSTGALTSANGGIHALSTMGSVALASAKAGSSLVANAKTSLALTTYTVSAGSATLTAGSTFTGTSGTASGNITLDAVGISSVGAVTSSAGTVDLEVTGAALTTGAVSGGAAVLLKSSGNLGTGALTSLNGSVNTESLTGSVAVTAASAKTGLVAKSGTTLNMTSFAVSAGAAQVTAGTDFTVGTGTAYGPITLNMTGIGSLGTLTSTTGAISATSSLKGLSFTTLKAGTGITLRAAANMGLGLNPAFAIIGTNLDAGTGAVDAQATTGNVQIGKLMAASASTVKALSGNLKITTVTLPATIGLTASATGTRSLPIGF
ncbi:leukotoxin LktA family filamentous adhesin [Limnohabitans sp. WS1]|uniref:leukotoxin LktA family filamentous adhesin n=1 Tax=Limnohabitans sp. WS1 TaxID=1100726 RepID=UPI000D34F399|nr:leukotoxin LktA family filamentous adhesin [Limnohabitans sp. WS1]PUE20245.1 hypothetical protein B9Z48_04790 [Limnohabitans sp. WS1]